MRKLIGICALTLLPVLSFTAYAATASAGDDRQAAAASSEPTPDAKHLPLQVYGEPNWALERGIAYWNDRAGHTVVRYAGRRLDLAAARDPHTVVVMFDFLTNGSGQTVGILGQTPQAMTIDSRSMFDWAAYARQFRQALDFDHHKTLLSGQRG